MPESARVGDFCPNEARRSVRDYTAQPLTLDDLSRPLHAAQGITEPRRYFRAAPSAGVFDDDDLNDHLGLDGHEEAALYVIAVGKG